MALEHPAAGAPLTGTVPCGEKRDVRLNRGAQEAALILVLSACGSAGRGVGTSNDGCDTETGCHEADTGHLDGRVLHVPEGFELCLVSPDRSTTASQREPLFHFRGRLGIDAGTFALPEAPGVETPFSLTSRLQLGREGSELVTEHADGMVLVEHDAAPHPVYLRDDVPGWDTLIYSKGGVVDASDGTEGEMHDGLRFVIVGAPSGSTTFELGGLIEAERELRRIVVTYLPSSEEDGDPLAAFAAPCSDPEAPVDRLDVTFAEGTASFHTRPARFRALDGFTVLAEGRIDGIDFEVDSYWDLEYATWSGSAESLYGSNPMVAARFPERPDGACILLIDWDHTAIEDDHSAYTAHLLDCAQNELRELTIEAMDWSPGGGEARW